MANKLYEFTIAATRKPGAEAQVSGSGALIPCYAADDEPQAAIRKAVSRLSGMGFAFSDLKGPVRELDVAMWPEYVAKVWPDLGDGLPPVELVPGIVEAGGVFFGPIAGFNG